MHPSGRIIFNELPDKLEIIIPGKRNWVTVGIVMAIVVFWCIAGGVTALLALPDKKEIDFSDWIWVLWGIAVFIIALRNLLAIARQREVIAFNKTTVSIKKQGSIFSNTQKYELSKARSFEVENDDDNDSLFDGRQADVVGSGNICFNYHRQIIRFAEGVTEAEAANILHQLKRKSILTDKNF